jgi:hypothetical protein
MYREEGSSNSCEHNKNLLVAINKDDSSNYKSVDESDGWTTVGTKSNKRKSDRISSISLIQNKRFNRETNWVPVYETIEQYYTTLKQIDTEQSIDGDKNCDWVYRIFEGKQELTNVLCVTKEFLIVTNNDKFFSTHGKLNPNKFTLVILLFDLSMRTIRDLDQTHIDLLMRMKQKAFEVINNYLGDFSSCEKRLSFEFHYTPSTYQLHLNVKFNRKPETEPNRKQRIYPLDVVIKNLKSDTDYYKKPIVIYVKDMVIWEENLSKWSEISLETIEKNKYNPETLEFWKFFEQMPCYKNYID